VRLGRDAVAEQDDGRPLGELPVELDRERVHRDGADNAPRLACDAHLRPREVATEPVRVADRNDPDPRVAVGDPAAAVPGRIARPEELAEAELARPRQDGLEPVLDRIRAERRQAVERDAAPCGVEARLGKAQNGRAVGRVARQLRVRVSGAGSSDSP
jgi:hypothetical protein